MSDKNGRRRGRLLSRENFSLSRELFKFNWRRTGLTISYAMLLRVLYLYFLFPAAGFMFRFTLNLTGFSYIRSDNLPELLRTALLPILFVFLILGALYIIFEYALMISFTTIKSSFSLRAECSEILKRMKDLYKPKNYLFFILLILYIPGNPYRLLGDVLDKIGVPSFIVSAIYSDLFFYIPYLLLIIFLVFCSVRYCLIFHYYFFEGLSAFEAAKKSSRMSKGHRKELLLAALLIQIFYAAVQIISLFSASIFLKPIELAQMRSDFALLRWGLLRSVSSIFHLFIELVFFLLWIKLVSILYNRVREDDRELAPSNYKFKSSKFLQIFKKRAPMTISIVAILVFFGLDSWNFSMGQLGQAYDNLFRPQIKVMGHRGEADFAPENTLPGILSAANNLAQATEIDVQLTKDEEVILLHDKTFARTSGVNKKPANMTLDEIKKLDVGEYFDDKYKGTKVPTLAEALELAKGRIILNIELKVDKHNEKKLAEKVCNLIQEKSMLEEVMLCSTSKKALREAKKILPDISCGLIVSFAYGDTVKDEGIDFYSLESSSASKERIDLIHDQGKEVYVWTVNDVDSLKKAYENGADGVITDQVLFCREWILKQETVRDDLLAGLARFIPDKDSDKHNKEISESHEKFPDAEIKELPQEQQELIEDIVSTEEQHRHKQ